MGGSDNRDSGVEVLTGLRDWPDHCSEERLSKKLVDEKGDLPWDAMSDCSIGNLRTPRCSKMVQRVLKDTFWS